MEKLQEIYYLKGQADEKLIFKDKYIPQGNTRYVFRNSKFIILLEK